MRTGLLACVLAPFAPLPSYAYAAGLAFDCDVPADRYSSVTGSDSSQGISGTITPVLGRSGNNVPLAGVKLVDAASTASVAIRMVATSKKANVFDVVLNISLGGENREAVVGKIEGMGPVPFRLTIDSQGSVTAAFGQIVVPPLPIAAGAQTTAMVFCSTGQFKFSELAF